MLSRKKMLEAEEVARKATYIEISLDPEFQNEFAESMMFPES